MLALHSDWTGQRCSSCPRVPWPLFPRGGCQCCLSVTNSSEFTVTGIGVAMSTCVPSALMPVRPAPCSWGLSPLKCSHIVSLTCMTSPTWQLCVLWCLKPRALPTHPSPMGDPRALLPSCVSQIALSTELLSGCCKSPAQQPVCSENGHCHPGTSRFTSCPLQSALPVPAWGAPRLCHLGALTCPLLPQIVCKEHWP